MNKRVWWSLYNKKNFFDQKAIILRIVSSICILEWKRNLITDPRCPTSFVLERTPLSALVFRALDGSLPPVPECVPPKPVKCHDVDAFTDNKNSA